MKCQKAQTPQYISAKMEIIEQGSDIIRTSSEWDLPIIGVEEDEELL